MKSNTLKLWIVSLALTQSLIAEKLPWTNFDPSLFDSWKFVNAVASDIALWVCEVNKEYINFVLLNWDNPLVLDDEKAFNATVNIKWKYNITKTLQSHVDRKKMAKTFTVTSNLENEISTYWKYINNVLNYISSKPNPCNTALEYAKHYKIVPDDYRLEKINFDK